MEGNAATVFTQWGGKNITTAFPVNKSLHTYRTCALANIVNISIDHKILHILTRKNKFIMRLQTLVM